MWQPKRAMGSSYNLRLSTLDPILIYAAGVWGRRIEKVTTEAAPGKQRALLLVEATEATRFIFMTYRTE